MRLPQPTGAPGIPCVDPFAAGQLRTGAARRRPTRPAGFLNPSVAIRSGHPGPHSADRWREGVEKKSITRPVCLIRPNSGIGRAAPAATPVFSHFGAVLTPARHFDRTGSEFRGSKKIFLFWAKGRSTGRKRFGASICDYAVASGRCPDSGRRCPPLGAAPDGATCPGPRSGERQSGAQGRPARSCLVALGPGLNPVRRRWRFGAATIVRRSLISTGRSAPPAGKSTLQNSQRSLPLASPDRNDGRRVRPVEKTRTVCARRDCGGRPPAITIACAGYGGGSAVAAGRSAPRGLCGTAASPGGRTRTRLHGALRRLRLRGSRRRPGPRRGTGARPEQADSRSDSRPWPDLQAYVSAAWPQTAGQGAGGAARGFCASPCITSLISSIS